mgnify:CR=1 FL=1
MDKNSPILIKKKSEKGVLCLTMNDLACKNALSNKMLSALLDEIKNSSIDKSIKVIVLTANGDVFSAGHDLKELTQARNEVGEGEPYFEKIFDQCSSLMQLIVTCSKPVIAEISGTATAAGCQLVATCDLALASSESKFATPGVNLGLFCSTPMVALTRAVKNKHAMEMLLTGDFIDAKKAKEIGLINNYYSTEELQGETEKLAIKIAQKSSVAVSTGKEAFYAQSDQDLAGAYKYTSKIMVENLLKDDAKEGIGAFIDKRKPNFRK